MKRQIEKADRALGLLRSAEGHLLDASYDLYLAECAGGALATVHTSVTWALGTLEEAQVFMRMARGVA